MDSRKKEDQSDFLLSELKKELNKSKLDPIYQKYRSGYDPGNINGPCLPSYWE